MLATGMSLSDAISGYQSGLKQHTEDVTKKIDTAAGEYKAKEAEADKAEAALDPSALTPPKMALAPVTQATEPVKIWGSAAMWVAALAGLITRRPLINSFNAMGSVLNAYKQGDAAAAKAAYDQWKTETDNAVKMAQFSIDAYKTALSKIESDKKSALTEFTTTAKALSDENAGYVAQHYGVDAAIRYVDALQAHVDRMKAEAPKIAIQQEQLQMTSGLLTAVKQLQAAKQSGDPAKIQAAQTAYQNAAQQVQAMNQGLGKGGSSGNFRSLPAAIANKYLQEHPDASAEDLETFAQNYTAGSAAVKAFDTGKQGDALRSFNTAIAHLGTLDSLVDALHNGDTQAFNRIGQRIAQETGQTAPTNFDAAKAIVGDEIVKAIIGGGGALADRENAQNQINKAESPEQLKGVIKTYKELMTGQLRGLRKQYESSTGRDDFNSKLLPTTLQELEGSGGGKGGAAPKRLKYDAQGNQVQ